jgi:hypothetical protein
MNYFKKYILAFVLIFILLGFCLSCRLENKNENQNSRKDIRVLFIGNSHIFTNSMPKVLSRMSLSPQSKVVLVTPQYVHGGYTLQQHWQDGNSVKLIQKGGWDYVVLQENGDLILSDPNLMREYMSKFVAEVKKVNAKPILFMTAAFQDKSQTTETIAELYGSVAKKLDVAVAPVGLAYKNAMEKQPGLTLHNLPDTIHANELGTYLTACVFYSVITEQNPKGLPDGGLKKVKQDDMQLLQQVAWETVRSYQGNRKK